MPSILRGSSEYHVDGDIVVVTVYHMVNPTTTNASLIAEGHAELVHNNTVYSRVEFTGRYGNEDGSIRLYFLHPQVTGGQIRVSVTLADATVLTDILTITKIDAPKVPTALNPDDAVF